MSMYARYDRGTYQTPVLTFTHPDSGRRVTLAGMMHHGQADYFEQVGTHVEKATAAGSIVLAEGNVLDPARLPADPTPEESVTITLVGRLAELSEQRFDEVLGWTNQMAVIKLYTTWLTCDLTPRDIWQRQGHPQVQATARNGIRALGWRPGSTFGPNRFALMLGLWMYMTASDQASHQRKALQGKGDDVVLDQRNEVVLAALDDTDPTDAVVVYGAGHIPGLHAGLLQRGFPLEPTEETWYSSGRIQEPPRLVLNMVTGRPPARLLVDPAPVTTDV